VNEFGQLRDRCAAANGQPKKDGGGEAIKTHKNTGCGRTECIGCGSVLDRNGN
jgi:hypothetical protein